MWNKMKKVMLILSILGVNTVFLVLFMGNMNRMLLKEEVQQRESQHEIINIYTTEEYLNFAEDVSGGNTYEGCKVILCNDLDFSENDHGIMIGKEGSPFAGVFDGNGKTISGLRIDHPESLSGMFAQLHGMVKNLQMDDCAFSGMLCGAVAADSYDGAVLNCDIDADTEGEISGSVIGRLHGNVLNCAAMEKNIAGEVQRGSVECCYDVGNEDTDALNKNLSYISGYYSDTDFYLWEKGEISEKKADLLETLLARIKVDGQELKLRAYYSCNDRKWCFALPALHKGAKMTIEAVTAMGGYEKFKREQEEETIIFTWKDLYYPIDFLCADNIDTLYVTLEKQKDLRDVHKNKLEEIPGILTVMDTEGNVKQEIIKGFYGHGNDSWAVEKKSYNLKMDSPADILGMGENEDFSLLACYRDNSLMCYGTTTEMVKELGFAYSPQFRFVNLYVAGEYAGVYFLAEKVEIDKNRIEITNVYEETKSANHNYMEGFSIREWKNEDSQAARYYYDVENDPQDITGGYLLEADIADYGPEESRFVSDRGIPITLKRARYSSEAQVNYIGDFWQEFEDALFAENGINHKGKHYSEYIDRESFAMQWLIYELVQEGSMSSSIYFYKESDRTGDGLLHACFPWDMEHSYVMSDKLDRIWNLTEKAETLYGYWKAFYRHEDFRQEMKIVWNEKFVPAIETMTAEEAIVTSSGMKNLRWYEERISDMNRLENSRWRKMYPLNRCQINREFLLTREAVLSEWLSHI